MSFLFGLLTIVPRLTAAEADEFRVVREADRQRMAATVAGDTARLAPLLSDDLRYAFSDGRLQTKDQYLAAVRGSRIRYTSSAAEEVELQEIAPGAVAMHGRMRLGARVEGRSAEFTLHFLSIWRREDGVWRLFAYQSSQLAAVR